MFRSTMIVLALALSSTLANAAGDAGCGLGSVVISKNSKGLQLLALTTNGTFSSQILGITFGTSNCSSSGIVMNEKEVQYFVEVNQQDLSREVAQGEGEKLQVLAQLHGCNTVESQKAFAQMAQRSYPVVFGSENAEDIVQNLKNSAAQDRSVHQLCQNQI